MMTIKQMLFSTLIIGCISNIILAEQQANHVPTHVHYEEFPPTNDYCFISAAEINTILNRAKKTLDDATIERFGHAIGTLPDEKDKCRLLLVFVKTQDNSELKSILEKQKQKYLK
jgi:hypothetical protein